MSGTVKVLNVKLQRADHNVSWGFNIQGGLDFGAPLSVGHVHPQSLAEKAQVLQEDFVLRIGGMSTQHMTHAQARDAILQQADYLEMTLQRGGAPRSEDYTSRYEFPKHQLMNPNNIEYAPVASPQVGIQLGGNRALLTQSYNSPMGLYSSKNLADTLVSTLNNMHMNDPKLISAAQQIKPKPDFAQPASNASYQTKPKPQIKVNQNVSKASIALTKPTNSNQNSANYPSSYGYMQPAMYQQQPQPQPYYQPYSPPPPPPRPVYQPPPPPPVQQYRPPPQNQMNRGNRGPATYNHAPPANTKMPSCASCHQIVRGPFISAVGKIWCPDHFVCARPGCGTNLHNVGFIEEGGKLYCENDFANFMANTCHKCGNKIVGECCYALDKTYHPECFTCGHCKQRIGSGSFHIEDGVIYCSKDFAAMFSVKCAGCEFPIEPLDKFFEALGQKYHTECFICSKCNVPLNGSYVAKGNKPYCKRHAY